VNVIDAIVGDGQNYLKTYTKFQKTLKATEFRFNSYMIDNELSEIFRFFPTHQFKPDRHVRFYRVIDPPLKYGYNKARIGRLIVKLTIEIVDIDGLQDALLINSSSVEIINPRRNLRYNFKLDNQCLLTR
jgi:hypothetical protein